MIIEKSNMSMASSRTYKSSTVSGSLSTIGGSNLGSLVSNVTTSLENHFKDILDDKETQESSEDSLNAKTSFDNGEMMLKGSRLSDIRRQSRETLSTKRIREMTLLFLLERIRRALHKNDINFGNEMDSFSMEDSDSYSKGGTTSDGLVYGADGSIVKSPYSGSLAKQKLEGSGLFSFGQIMDFARGKGAFNIRNSMGGLSAGNGYISRIDLYDHYEEENTEFNTEGEVVTSDGRRLGFNVSLKMSRSFQETYLGITEQPFSVADLCDPLVINLDDNIASVTDQEFTFDIDNDGIVETMKTLNKNRGFIALDKNGDGKINDGSELFGTKSGDGFKDLAAYDLDGNGWIDEADDIFNKLLIWTKDENGKDMLYHLKDKGVGAISLESINTDFSLKDIKDGATNAVIRQTGIFLYENGGVGTMQHLDLAT